MRYVIEYERVERIVVRPDIDSAFLHVSDNPEISVQVPECGAQNCLGKRLRVTIETVEGDVTR